MANLMYQYTEGKIGKVDTPVALDGKIVGTIKIVEGGYQYFPKGSKHGGDIFSTLDECQKSLNP